MADKTKKKESNTAKIYTPHDAFFKFQFSSVDRARDFFETYLPKEALKFFQFDKMQAESSEFISEKLKKLLSDALFSVPIKGTDAYIYCLCEHQSTAQELMMFRFESYKIEIMKKHLDKGNKKLPIILPVLLYQGEDNKVYPYSMDYFDCFEEPEIAKELASYAVQLVDLSAMSDQEIIDHGKVNLMFQLVMKHARDRNFGKTLLKLIKDNPKFKQSFIVATEDELKAFFYYVLDQEKGESNSVEIITELDKVAELGDRLMNLRQYIEKKNQALGEARGVHIGEDKKAHEMAMMMLKNGEPVDKIAMYSTLPLTEVKKLKSSITH